MYYLLRELQANSTRGLEQIGIKYNKYIGYQRANVTVKSPHSRGDSCFSDTIWALALPP